MGAAFYLENECHSWDLNQVPVDDAKYKVLPTILCGRKEHQFVTNYQMGFYLKYIFVSALLRFLLN